jgi:DNA-directed RNA polymerase subunit M/transcription elongation factor TFIIS
MILTQEKKKILYKICNELSEDYYRKNRYKLEKKDINEKLKYSNNNYIKYIKRHIDIESPDYCEKFIKKIINTEEYDELKKIISVDYIDKEFWEYYEINEKKREEANKLLNIKANSNIKCKKCQGNVYVNVAQTRGCDEGMTSFFTCISCGNKWKYG